MKTACPRCGANVSFMPGTQKLYCEYCGCQINISEFEMVENYNNESGTIKNQEKIYDEYTCSTCGAKLVTDKTTMITDCVFCGSRQIKKTNLQSNFNPKAIIPFKINRNQFVEIITKRIKKQLLVSDDFINSSKILESKGVYVPYKLYHFNVDIYARGVAERTSDNSTSYKWFETKFSQNMQIPQDSSDKLDDEFMRELAPFDYRELIEYNPTYLNGFLAEGGNESEDILEKKAENCGMGEIKSCVDYSLQRDTSQSYIFKRGLLNVNFDKLESKDIMLPVWLANINYKNKNITLAVNGQTGKIVGEIPNKIFNILVTLLLIFVIGLFVSIGGGCVGIIPTIILVPIIILLIILFITIFILVFADIIGRKEGMVNNPLAHQDPIQIFNIRNKQTFMYSKGEYHKKYGTHELENLTRQLYRNGINQRTKEKWNKF